MDFWLKIFKHLLPHGRIGRLTIDRTLRQFFQGLTGLGRDAKLFVDQVWLDIFPGTTRELDAWEQQWGLPAIPLTDAERRARLDARWKSLGGQSPRYIQDTLRARGFDVYVHDWWEPGTELPVGVPGCVPPRDPVLYLRREFTGRRVGTNAGESFMLAGEAFAQAGNGLEPLGYPLVNRLLQTVPDNLILAGEFFARSGEPIALAGNFLGYKTQFQEYVVPNDPAKWPYFLYIGAEDINDVATIDPKRQGEFETLCLQICPTHLWIGVIVTYT